jgi:shikimate kinase
MMTEERILITGFMAAGKTTIAAALAQRLACPMLDLDQLIVEREGRSIGTIIDEDGEARFREVEENALREALVDGTARVIALGGGTWTKEGNRALIAEHRAFAVWLDTPFALCWRRIVQAGADARPLARDKESAHRLYHERRALYKLAAIHIRVGETDDASLIVNEILDALPIVTTKEERNQHSEDNKDDQRTSGRESAEDSKDAAQRR